MTTSPLMTVRLARRLSVALLFLAVGLMACGPAAIPEEENSVAPSLPAVQEGQQVPAMLQDATDVASLPTVAPLPVESPSLYMVPSDQSPTAIPEQVMERASGEPTIPAGSPQEDSEEEEPTATPQPTVCVAWPTQEAGDPGIKCIVSFLPKTTPVYSKVLSELGSMVEEAEARAREEGTSQGKSAAETSVASETLGVLIVSESLEDDAAIKRWLKGHGITPYGERSNESQSQFAARIPVLLVGELSELDAVRYLKWDRPTTPP